MNQSNKQKSTELKFSQKLNTGPFIYKTPIQEYINDLDFEMNKILSSTMPVDVKLKLKIDLLIRYREKYDINQLNDVSAFINEVKNENMNNTKEIIEKVKIEIKNENNTNDEKLNAIKKKIKSKPRNNINLAEQSEHPWETRKKKKEKLEPKKRCRINRKIRSNKKQIINKALDTKIEDEDENNDNIGDKFLKKHIQDQKQKSALSVIKRLQLKDPQQIQQLTQQLLNKTQEGTGIRKQKQIKNPWVCDKYLR